MLTTAIPESGQRSALCSSTLRHAQYDRVLQQQLSLFQCGNDSSHSGEV